MVRILNLLTAGGVGGIEVLCKDIGVNSTQEHTFCFMFGEGKIYQQMKEMGQNVVSLSKYSKISIRRLFALYSLAKEYEIVVVHHDDPFLELYYLLLNFFFKKKKFISMVHHCFDKEGETQYGVIKRSLKHFIIMIMFSYSDMIIFVSKAGYISYLDTFKIDEQKVRVVYNGIGSEKLKKGLQVKKEVHDELKIVYIGRLVKLKGVHQLLNVFAELDDKYLIYLEIIGDGPERISLEKEAKNLKIENKICFRGFQDDVTPYLVDADIFVYPSKTEIFGISIVEALAFRNICVANNVGGIPEIIKDGENGFLNLENTTKGLMDKVEQALTLYRNDEKREQMRDMAQETASKFTIQKTVERLDAVCQQLYGEKNAI